jgi:hypothetical protein
MARVRDAINERLSGPIDPQLADHVPDLLRAVTAALLMLEFPRAVAVLERITTHVRKMIEPGAADMRRHALDRLADAIVSVEYFMETVRAGRKSPVFMLENAETCLDAMPRLEPECPSRPSCPSTRRSRRRPTRPSRCARWRPNARARAAAAARAELHRGAARRAGGAGLRGRRAARPGTHRAVHRGSEGARGGHPDPPARLAEQRRHRRARRRAARVPHHQGQRPDGGARS